MKKSLITIILFYLSYFLYSQVDDGWNNRFISTYGNDIETARVSITFEPGFETTGHDDFLAYIDPYLPINGGTPITDGEFNLNFIRIFEPIKDNATDVIPIHNNIDLQNDWAEKIIYYDGLGRSIQEVGVMASPYGTDLVLPIAYDKFGRQDKLFSPYGISQDGANGPGGFRTNFSDEQNEFYSTFYGVEDGEYAFSRELYDQSPLNRVVDKSTPGYDWRINGNHTVKILYGTNVINKVYLFTVSENNDLKKITCYAENTLFKYITTDEDGNISTVYKDIEGKLVQEIVNTGSEELITQYVYDELNQLRYVLPPKTYIKFPSGTTPQTFSLSTDWIKELCFYYQYDKLGRNIIKKIPGKDIEYLVYNRSDELILTQDGELRKNNQWLFTKYDVFGRPITTGIYQHEISVDQAGMQDIVNSSTYRIYEKYISNQGYTNSAFPILDTDDEINTLQYYDNYTALELETTPEDYSFVENDLEFAYLENNSFSTNLKGLPTISKTNILGSGGSNMLISVTYYDSYNREIQTISKNHLDGISINSFLLDFTGNIVETKETVAANSTVYTIHKKITYDHVGNIVETKHKLNDLKWVVLNNNKYSELGNLVSKKLGQNVNGFYQDINYNYNIKGWLTGINNTKNIDVDYFALKLDYNTSESNPLYNGNISSMQWQSNIFNDTKRYDFSYDGASRLTSSIYMGNYDYTTRYTYDKNGNIESIYRMGEIGNMDFGLIDDIELKYNGNKLITANDIEEVGCQENGFTDNGSFLNTDEYSYDANANLISDLNKQIESISYNYLNLPEHFTFYFEQYYYLDYLYNANGEKLRKSTRANGITTDQVDYIGSFVFNNNEIDYIQTDEGRIVTDTKKGFKYEYKLTDHLGNIRVMFDENGEITQDNNYYPFGMSLGKSLTYNSIPSSYSSQNKHLYNDKEFQGDFGLNWYDYGARFYDPQLGRFHVNDAYAEKYHSQSSYQYALNNPISFIDINGDSAWTINNSWNEEYAQQYQSSVQSTIKQYEKDGKEFTCEDLALSVMMDFAEENGLPVTITNGEGTFDARSDDYTDAETFKNDVLTTTGAPDLQNNQNTTTIDASQATSGDIILNRNSEGRAHHTQVVYSPENSIGVMGIKQGNSGWLNRVRGSSYVLGAGNPKSSFYTGKPVESAIYVPAANFYKNYSTGKTHSNYSNKKNIVFKRFNFSNF